MVLKLVMEVEGGEEEGGAGVDLEVGGVELMEPKAGPGPTLGPREVLLKEPGPMEQMM